MSTLHAIVDWLYALNQSELLLIWYYSLLILNILQKLWMVGSDFLATKQKPEDIYIIYMCN